jgi:hypothetical protein
MGLTVLLVAGSHEVPLGADVVTRLRDLGITHVALVGDGKSTGFVLEGWAFDPAQSSAAAAAVLGVEARTLRPLAQMAVSAALPEGRPA